MLEAEATADMLLMTQPFTAPVSAPEIVEEPVAAQLVKAVLAGQRERYSALYEMYSPMVHGILLARVPRGEVDDLMQDIFLHALRKLHTLRDAAAFGIGVGVRAVDRDARAAFARAVNADTTIAAGDVDTIFQTQDVADVSPGKRQL